MQNENTKTVKEPKVSMDTQVKWLESFTQDMVIVDKNKVEAYEVAYKTFLGTQSEIINTIAVFMYDKVGTYQYIREEFTKQFGIECKFNNKAILKHIVNATFSQFKAEISPEMESMRDNAHLCLDLNFSKWLIKDTDGNTLRADESLIKYLPKVLSYISKILSANKDTNAQKVYVYKGKRVSKNSLAELIALYDDISVISHTLEAIIKDYNEAYNINVIFNKALKPYDKSKLVALLTAINPDILDKMLVEYAPTVEDTVDGEEVA